MSILVHLCYDRNALTIINALLSPPVSHLDEPKSTTCVISFSFPCAFIKIPISRRIRENESKYVVLLRSPII